MNLSVTRNRFLGVVVAATVTAVTSASLWSCHHVTGSDPDAPGGSATITLDGSVRYQTIDGWAVYPRYWEDDKVHDRFDGSFAPYVAAVSRLLVDEVGINAVRLEIWSGMENRTDRWTPFFNGTMSYTQWANYRYEKVNDNADPNSTDLSGFQFNMFDYRFETMVLPLRQALEARGEKLFINLCYVDFNWSGTVQGSLSHAQNPEEFAEFVLVFFKHLQNKYGLTPDAFEMILEPENTAAWRGPTIGRALVAASDRLRQNGFTPEFIAPSNAAMSNAITYFDQMIAIPGVPARLATFSYHRYGSESRSDVDAIRQRAQARGLKTAMLEKVGAGIDVLLEDLLVGQVSSWQQWAVAGKSQDGDKGAFYALVDGGGASPAISVAKDASQLAQVFRFVRRGARRIKTQNAIPTQTSVAFINPDGTWVVVARARAADASFTLRGLPAGQYGLRFISDALVREEPAPMTVPPNGLLSWSIPAPGVLTVYGLR